MQTLKEFEFLPSNLFTVFVVVVVVLWSFVFFNPSIRKMMDFIYVSQILMAPGIHSLVSSLSHRLWTGHISVSVTYIL